MNDADKMTISQIVRGELDFMFGTDRSMGRISMSPDCRKIIRQEMVAALAAYEKLKGIQGNIEVIREAMAQHPELKALIEEDLK